MRAWFSFVAILCLGAVAFGAWRAHGRQPPQPPPPDPEEPLGPIRLAPTWEVPTPARPIPVASTGHLTVRVVDENGNPFPLQDDPPMLIVIQGEARRLADAPEDGFWGLDLAPGACTLDAYTGTLVGTTGPLTIQPGDERTLTIRLGESAHIRGRVVCPEDAEELCEGWKVSVTLTNTGEREGTLVDDIQAPSFDLNGFLPGRPYDLIFSRDGSRQVRRAGVVAPAELPDLRSDPAPTLRGAIGIRKGDPCPAIDIRMIDDEADRIYVGYFDRWCRFEFPGLPEAGRLRIDVPGHPSLNRSIELPPVGDPPFLCLSGVCQEPRPEDKATLIVSLDDPDQDFVAYLRYLTTPPSQPRSHGGIGTIQFTGLESGIAAEVIIPYVTCATQSQTIQLGPGLNRVHFPCPTVETDQPSEP